MNSEKVRLGTTAPNSPGTRRKEKALDRPYYPRFYLQASTYARGLTQAAIDDALARLGVWRALLGVAAAEGDLTPFLGLAGE
jgi:hypothetical protein